MSQVLRSAIRSLLMEGPAEVAAARRRLEEQQMTFAPDVEAAAVAVPQGTPEVATTTPVSPAATEDATKQVISQFIDPANWNAAGKWYVNNKDSNFRAANSGLIQTTTFPLTQTGFQALEKLADEALAGDKNSGMPAHQIFLATGLEPPTWKGDVAIGLVNIIGDLVEFYVGTRVGGAALGAMNPAFNRFAAWVSTKGVLWYAGIEAASPVINGLVDAIGNNLPSVETGSSEVKLPDVPAGVQESKWRSRYSIKRMLSEGAERELLMASLKKLVGNIGIVADDDVVGAALILLLRKPLRSAATEDAIPESTVLQTLIENIRETASSSGRAITFDSADDLARFIQANKDDIITAEVQQAIREGIRDALLSRSFITMTSEIDNVSDAFISRLLTGEPTTLATQVLKNFSQEVGAILPPIGSGGPVLRRDVQCAMSTVGESWQKVANGETKIENLGETVASMLDAKSAGLRALTPLDESAGLSPEVSSAWLGSWDEAFKSAFSGGSKEIDPRTTWIKMTGSTPESSIYVRGLFVGDDGKIFAREISDGADIQSATPSVVPTGMLLDASNSAADGVKTMAGNINQSLGRALQSEVDTVTALLRREIETETSDELANKLAEVIITAAKKSPDEVPAATQKAVNTFLELTGVEVPSFLTRLKNRFFSVFMKSAQRSTTEQADKLATDLGSGLGSAAPKIIKNILVIAITYPTVEVLQAKAANVYLFGINAGIAKAIEDLGNFVSNVDNLKETATKCEAIAKQIESLYSGATAAPFTPTATTFDKGGDVVAAKYRKIASNITAYITKVQSAPTEASAGTQKESKYQMLRAFLRESIRNSR